MNLKSSSSPPNLLMLWSILRSLVMLTYITGFFPVIIYAPIQGHPHPLSYFTNCAKEGGITRVWDPLSEIRLASPLFFPRAGKVGSGLGTRIGLDFAPSFHLRVGMNHTTVLCPTATAHTHELQNTLIACRCLSIRVLFLLAFPLHFCTQHWVQKCRGKAVIALEE